MKPKFQINKPAQPTDEIKKFAQAAEGDGSVARAASPPDALQPEANQESQGSKFPWEDLDDNAAGVQYNVKFPARLYKKLIFLRDNEPGGPSIRKLTLEALEPYVEERLKKHMK